VEFTIFLLNEDIFFFCIALISAYLSMHSQLTKFEARVASFKGFCTRYS